MGRQMQTIYCLNEVRAICAKGNSGPKRDNQRAGKHIKLTYKALKNIILIPAKFSRNFGLILLCIFSYTNHTLKQIGFKMLQNSTPLWSFEKEQSDS